MNTLHEKICRLIICMPFDKLNALAVKYISDEVILHLYVILLCMKDRILCEHDNIMIVTMKDM
mgnify:CR=1 FL=1